MRLWHQDLISKLPRQQLLGQHRECCALRGNGWGKKHSTVDYVFRYRIERLWSYHYLIMDEMTNRGYNVNSEWLNPKYRGKNIGLDNDVDVGYAYRILVLDSKFYQEHDDAYMLECLENLRRKGIEIAS